MCISFVGFWAGRNIYAAIFLGVPGRVCGYIHENPSICTMALWDPVHSVSVSVSAAIGLCVRMSVCLAFHGQVPALEAPGLRSLKG